VTGYLLDTHSLIWAAIDPARLGPKARQILAAADLDVFASAVSAMEIATKFRLGKLPEGEAHARDFAGEIGKDGYLPLSLTIEHAQRGGGLAIAHRDPFDRLLIAQALIEDLTLISNETLFDQTGVSRLW
jgi:PIN domain nuclease of toxin-antitoxin system